MTRVVEDVAQMLGEAADRSVPIGPLTTYRAGGAAALLARVETEDDLSSVGRAVKQSGIDVLALGRGSNTLVADAGFAGLVIVLGVAFAEIAIDGTVVACGGAASLPRAARKAAACSLTGFEWAVGVPGSIGGAVRMNAGGHGSDMASVLERVRVVDLLSGEDKEVESNALDLRYRCSAVAPHHLVVRADIRLSVGDRRACEDKIDEIVRWRRDNQPGGPNAGSVFTNPPNDSAGRLIEAAGLKGRRIGSAEVSAKHGNFIQVDTGGSADDVYVLMREIQLDVQAATGVELVPETRLVGFGEIDKRQWPLPPPELALAAP